MTVRAADMQTMIPRLNEASRLQHHNDVQPQVAQHANTQAAQAQAERARQQVNANTAAEQGRIGRDGKRGQGGGQPQSESGGKGRSQKGKEGPAEPGVGSRLDVKV